MDDATTWELIHAERAAVADMLDTLTPEQWTEPSLCVGWTVKELASHIVVGAEQTPFHFTRRLVRSAFRFNTMTESDVRQFETTPTTEIIARIRARTTTTNRPPAPVMAMLGEIVVHGEDVRRPLSIPSASNLEAAVPCLDMYSKANFPVGGKKRISGLRLVASDVDWTHGSGAEVTGPALSMILAMTGRIAGLDELSGEGVVVLRGRMR